MLGFWAVFGGYLYWIFQNGFLLQVVDLECVIIMNMSDVLPPLFFLEDFSNGPAVPIWLKSWKSSLLFLCFLSGTAMYLWILLQGSGSSISGLSGNGTKADIRVLSVETIWANHKNTWLFRVYRGWNRKPSYMGIISYKQISKYPGSLLNHQDDSWKVRDPRFFDRGSSKPGRTIPLTRMDLMMMVYPKIIASTIWTGSRNGKLFGGSLQWIW